MTDEEQPTSAGQLLIYRDEAGDAIGVLLDGETVWLTQAQIAELYQGSKQNISLHIQHIFEEGELRPEATVKQYLTVRHEGSREVRRRIDHYNLDMILAVGYRVRSHRGTQFRQWATARLECQSVGLVEKLARLEMTDFAYSALLCRKTVISRRAPWSTCDKRSWSQPMMRQRCLRGRGRHLARAFPILPNWGRCHTTGPEADSPG